jgi:GNAT superfamily N-acetyltransferase
MKLVKLENNEADFGRMYDLIAENFSKEHQMGSLSAKNFDFEKGVLWWEENVACAAWAVEDDDGKFIGSLGLHEETPWYSNKPYLIDGWFYVRPEHRFNNIGTVLVEAAKEYAAERELPLMIGIFNMEDINEKVEAFQRMGMKLASATFIAGE